MKIDHIAVWTDDIERMREFYLTYFDISCGEKYINPAKQYSSYFLTFNIGGTRIELMNKSGIAENESHRWLMKGLAHLCISLGSKEAVDQMTERFRQDGYTIASEPRTSGD